jgi:uncharacterized repeat protein (TIGR01451 family)
MQSLRQCTIARKRINLQSRGSLASIVMLVLIAALAPGGAAAQVTSTTTDIGMIQGLNLPWAVQILPGTATSSITGNPVRHVWEGDQAGFCRIDPDLDSPGPYTVNTNTCVTTVAGVKFTPGRTAFDPTTNTLYTVNNAKPSSVARLHVLPNGDSGQGLISATSEFLGDAGGCGVSGSFPWAISLGPDGGLYVSFRKSGNIIRILGPQSATVPCAGFQVMGSTHDGKIGKGLGWIGHDLWGADGIGLFRIGNGDQCFTPANNFSPCKGVNLLVALVANPLGMFSDQNYPATNGGNIYAFDPTGTNIALVSGLSVGVPAVQKTWVSNIQPGLTIAVDNTNPQNEVLYLGSDPAIDVPAVTNAGWIDKIVNAPPTIPDIPNQVTALAGDGQATVSWQSGGGGTATSYTVHNSFASNGLTVPDVTVIAPAGSTFVPTTASVTGLTDGVSYQWEVSASNAFGTSQFSLPSNSVTPHVTTAPSAPGTVVAAPSNAAATIAWTTPTADGGSAITSYTVSSYIGGVPTGLGVFVVAPATSATMSGLTNGTTYTFTVHATNAVGSSPESLPSNAVTPTAPQLGPPDLAIAMTSGPAPNLGGNITYTIVVTNLGPSAAPSVAVSDPIPIGATFVSASTTQGVCSGPPGLAGVQCLMSGLPVGGSATIAVTLTLTGTITVNSASVQGFDAAGAPLADPNPLNNTATVTTQIAVPTAPTDIQVGGSAQNGGPAVGSTDTFTWQIKNGQSPTANQVTFSSTLPASLRFQSVTSTLSTCDGPAPGTSGTITCVASSVGGGQTMTVVVTVTVATSGTIPVTGSADFNGTDNNPANNSFTVTINAK